MTWRRVSIARYQRPMAKAGYSAEEMVDRAIERRLFAPVGKAYPLVMMTVHRDPSGAIGVYFDQRQRPKWGWETMRDGLPPELFGEFAAMVEAAKERV